LRFNLELHARRQPNAALVALEKHLITVREPRASTPLLMMDEGAELSMDLLEEIRLLSNLEHKGDKCCRSSSVGQPELGKRHLAAAELRQVGASASPYTTAEPACSPD